MGAVIFSAGDGPGFLLQEPESAPPELTIPPLDIRNSVPTMGRMTAFSLHRRYLLPLAAGLLSLFVVSCESTKKPKSGYDDVVDYTTPKTGLSQEEYPFDKNGNYLADVVSGKKKGQAASSSYKPVDEPIPYASTSGSSYTDTYEKPVITAVDTPSSRRNPIYEKVPEPDSPKPASSSSGSSSSAKSKPAAYTSGSASASSKTKPKPSTAGKTSASKTTAKPAVASTKSGSSKTKGKPEPVKAKPKAAPKPAYASYKVKNGDTLYGLANRYGTSVGAIKQANGMSSNTLVNGRTLRIPKK